MLPKPCMQLKLVYLLRCGEGRASLVFVTAAGSGHESLEPVIQIKNAKVLLKPQDSSDTGCAGGPWLSPRR